MKTDLELLEQAQPARRRPLASRLTSRLSTDHRARTHAMTFATLTPLARAAVPESSRTLHRTGAVGGARARRLPLVGRAAARQRRCASPTSRAAPTCAALLYNHEEKTERYNMPDTLKAQHTAFLTHGHVCYSDMGRVLCSITEDSAAGTTPSAACADDAAWSSASTAASASRSTATPCTATAGTAC